MARERKTWERKKPSLNGTPAPPPPLNPETGLPAVGRGLPNEGERIVARAREKHLHKQRYRR